MPKSNPHDLISRLMIKHVTSELRSYQGNLTHAVHIIKNGWLPDVGAPEVSKHLETLQQYLVTTGQAEDNLFLLRLGLTIPGMQRGIIPPLLVLEPNRGGFSIRRQQEAAGQITRLQEALAIGRRFLPSLSFDTQQAVIELSELAENQPAPQDTDWLDSFHQLSDGDAEKLALRALACLGANEESVHEVGIRTLKHLACFRYSSLTENSCLSLIDRGVLWPSSLFRGCSERVAQRLVELIECANDSLALNHKLLALAWTRSKIAEQAFRLWAVTPPDWTASLHVPPADYLPSAGWWLDANDQARQLVSIQCFRLREPEEGESNRIGIRIKANEDCPSCGSDLVWLFDFSRARPHIEQTDLSEAPIRVLCCLYCACYGPVFSRYFANGKSEFISATGDVDLSYAGEVQSRSRQLTPVPCPPFACAEPFGLTDASTLGGVPMWLQDAEYPRCIECGQYMAFLAQHDNGALGEEGIHYAFYCAPCRVSAVGYQQT